MIDRCASQASRILAVLGRTCAIAILVLATRQVDAQTASKQNGEAVEWPSIVCRGAKCETMQAKGWLFAKPGQKNVVIVSHGSSGINYIQFDRVDALQEAGYAALVIDHWGSRGLGEQLTDLKGAQSRGATELNMAFDIYTAASFLRKERDFDKVGSIGGSGGGGAQIMAQQKWAISAIEKTMEHFYKRPFVARKLEAQVGLYAFCGYRNKVRDAFNGAPLMLISGEKDDMTPAEYCERITPWMNERGGRVQFVNLPGAYHTFDAREGMHRIQTSHMAKCDLIVDEKGITNLKTGDVTPGGNEVLGQAVAKCANAFGFTSGNTGDRNIATPHWLSFFRGHLQ